MTSLDIRKKFIDYYTALGHAEVENASLIPANDTTTLFMGSGMQPLVPYLMGQKHPLGTRLVNVQRCLRAEDLDEIGDGRHHSFFEMLGCWSLGDYFKVEQIPWTFSFFVDELGIDPAKLYVTVFAGEDGLPRDMESAEIWRQVFAKRGIQALATEDVYKVGEGNYRIFYYPKKKNWWERNNGKAPVGDPAGPDTEIFYFTGEEHDPRFGEKCHVNCDCQRFVEIGNDVFMQYKKTGDSSYVELEQKNVDCGWGFERIVRVVQNKKDNFATDLFLPIINQIQAYSTIRYGEMSKTDWVYRLCADHLRAAVFLTGDGVLPSNKLQGYILRRILRRVIFQSKKLHVTDNFLASVAGVVVDAYSPSYPHLLTAKPRVLTALVDEETKFTNTLDKGLKEMAKLAQKTNGKFGQPELLVLYETYGVPMELAKEICTEKGWNVV